MSRYGNYLPNPPKSFGSWLKLYRSLDLGENRKRIAYFEDKLDSFNGKKHKTIDVSVLCKYVMQECSQTTDKIIKLNEELTAENARIITELEGITSDKNNAECAYNDVFFKYEDLLQRVTKYKLELTSIKSKWWYKLMTWEW